jgi:hypothetical protein
VNGGLTLREEFEKMLRELNKELKENGSRHIATAEERAFFRRVFFAGALSFEHIICEEVPSPHSPMSDQSWKIAMTKAFTRLHVEIGIALGINGEKK